MGNNKLILTPRPNYEEYRIFSVRLKEKLVDKLDNVTYACNMYRNELITLCLEFALENIDITSIQKE